MFKRLVLLMLLLIKPALSDPIHLNVHGIWGQFSPGYFASSISATAGNFEIIGGNRIPYRGNGTPADPYLYSSGTWPLLQQNFPVPRAHCASTHASLASWPICATFKMSAAIGYLSAPFTFPFIGTFVALMDELFFFAAGVPPQPWLNGTGHVSTTFKHIDLDPSYPLWTSDGLATLYPASAQMKVPDVPEPATLLLLGSGFAATVFRRPRYRKGNVAR